MMITGTRLSDYIVVKQIGYGSFSDVYLAKHIIDEKHVAIKEVKRKQLNKKLAISVLNEILFLKAINHPNIVKLYEVFYNDSSIFLIMEYCSGGDLQKILHNGSLHENIARKIFIQIINGLKLLYDLNLFHRDLKPQNILLDSSSPKCLAAGNFQVKIADFGFARLIDKNRLADTLCGSPLYMAPEILKHNRYGSNADLWSLGVILFEMTQGRVPYYSSNHIGLIEKIENSDSIRLSIKLSDNAVDLLNQLLKSNPEERISFKSLFSHSWITLKSEFITSSSNLIFPNESKDWTSNSGFVKDENPDIDISCPYINFGHFSLYKFDFYNRAIYNNSYEYHNYQKLDIILSCFFLLFEDLDFRVQFSCKIALLIIEKCDEYRWNIDPFVLMLLDNVRMIIKSSKNDCFIKSLKYHPLLFRKNLIILAYLISKKAVVKNMQKNNDEASKLFEASKSIFEFLNEEEDLLDYCTKDLNFF